MKAPDEWQNSNKKAAIFLTLIGACLGAVLLYKSFINAFITPAIEVTDSQRVEIAAMIERFELKWSGLEAYHDPSLQAEIATGPYLKYYGFAYDNKEAVTAPGRWVTRSAKAMSIRVLEDSTERIKAIASVAFLEDWTTPTGEVLQTLNGGGCKVYAFVRVASAWKLVGLFDITEPTSVVRDWPKAPDWLKQAVGEIRYYDRCD